MHGIVETKEECATVEPSCRQTASSMTLLRRIFGHWRRRTIERPRFGTLAFTPPDTWTVENFSFGGRSDVQLILQAASAGPTERHVDRLRELESRYETLLPDLIAAIDSYRGLKGSVPRHYILSSIYLPEPSENSELSVRLWYEDPSVQDEWFGVEVHRWQRLVAFAED